METLEQQIEYIVRNKPHTAAKIMHKWAVHYSISQNEIDQAVEGNHIVDEAMYMEAVSLLCDKNHTKGPKWSKDEIKNMYGKDFSSVDFTCYDFAYAVNMMYSDYGHRISNIHTLMGMAEDYLTDPDYMGEADERSYHDAVNRIEYHKKG